MNKVSFYIAKRYNTYTLLISMALITIAALLTGTLTYMTNTSAGIFKIILYRDTVIGINQQLIIYALSFLYILIQMLLIYLLFQRLFKKLKPGSKLPVSLLIAALCAVLVAVIYLSGTQTGLWAIVSLILISTSLLSLIIGLLSFLFSRRKITGVNIITSIAVFAITIASCALFIILSVFSGLEKMNIRLFTNVNPDLKISSVKGKTLANIDEITHLLDKDEQIE